MSDWVTLQESLGLKFRPIDTWPGKLTYDRLPSPFSAPLKDTLAKLKRELTALKARDIVLQIAIREQDLRLDGLPRANAIATHPGIMLSFTCPHGPLRLSFDGFNKWQHNLRAIAMHLEHLRMAGLYGVGRAGEQYRGWAALPAPTDGEFSNVMDAAVWLSTVSGVSASGIVTDEVLRKQAYRTAASRLHPDIGGSAEAFRKLQKAMEWW